jgi:hypothetical protein
MCIQEDAGASQSPVMMKIVFAGIVVLSLGMDLAAQSLSPAANVPPSQNAAQTSGQSAGQGLSTILAALQRTTQAANLDVSRLRIEKWKANNGDKEQMQQIAGSLQKNLTMAVPGLINEAQASPASVSKAFKLYHNINLVYEYLNNLSDAAAVYGKKDEYQPLAGDVSSLDSARKSLSDYIEQAANTLEVEARKPPPPAVTQSAPPPKKVVIDDGAAPPKKARKKKAPAASSASSSSAGSSSTPSTPPPR